MKLWMGSTPGRSGHESRPMGHSNNVAFDCWGVSDTKSPVLLLEQELPSKVWYRPSQCPIS